MSIAAKIRTLRIELGLSQAKVAKALGVDRSAIAQWENGLSEPRMGNVRKLAKYFGVPVSEIVDNDELSNDKGATVRLRTLRETQTSLLSNEEAGNEIVEVPRGVLANHPVAEATIAESDCMDRIIPVGTVILYDPDLAPSNGSIVIAKTDSERQLLRRWYHVGKTIVLVADSHSKYEDIVITPDKAIELFGTVVWMQSPLEAR